MVSPNSSAPPVPTRYESPTLISILRPECGNEKPVGGKYTGILPSNRLLIAAFGTEDGDERWGFVSGRDGRGGAVGGDHRTESEPHGRAISGARRSRQRTPGRSADLR